MIEEESALQAKLAFTLFLLLLTHALPPQDCSSENLQYEQLYINYINIHPA